MADKGIIFSGPMVRALLDGRKSQTRRLLNPQPDWIESSGRWRWPIPKSKVRPGCCEFVVTASREWHEYLLPGQLPYAPGDRLYVREAWSHTAEGVWDIAAARMSGRGGVIYSADGKKPGAKYWPSIHMPREFSRLWLSVTDVRVQRVQEISSADAIAEGIEQTEFWRADHPPSICFSVLWNSLHNKPGERWEDDPWIVAISFTVHHGNIDSNREPGRATAAVR